MSQDSIVLDYGLPDNPADLEEWLKSKPPEVRAAAKVFPIGHEFHIRDQTFWTVGYSPEGYIVALKKNPQEMTELEFKNAVEQGADVLDPNALMAIVTRH